jgi:hypothetical protein
MALRPIQVIGKLPNGAHEAGAQAELPASSSYRRMNFGVNSPAAIACCNLRKDLRPVVDAADSLAQPFSGGDGTRRSRDNGRHEHDCRVET